jgi:TolB-like protein/Tfp pilus assembly protein PilF
MSFIAELKRRNVVKVAVLYLVAAWFLLQVADVLASLLPVPEWTGSFVFILLVIGFPLVLIFSWVYELTPEGIKREKDVDRSHSITGETGRKINFLIIALLVLAIGVVALDRFMPREVPVAETVVVEESGPEKMADPAALAAAKFAPAPDRSIAVLPFVNMSGNPENEYFSDGLTEELLNVLAKVDGLRVAARTSSFRFKGEVGDPAVIGQALNVNHLLEGSVRQSGDRIRITAQLINAADGYHLWSETYDRTLDDVFAIQDEISRAVGQALEVRLLGDETREQSVQIATRNMGAYNAYLKGTQKLASSGVEPFRAAEGYFRQAIELDPDFAGAHAGLAQSWVFLVTWGTLGMKETYPKIEEQVEKAVGLNPDLPSAWTLRGWLRYNRDQKNPDRAGAAQALRQALALEPGNALASEWLAATLNEMGRREDAVAILDEAIERDPLSVSLRRQLGVICEQLTWYERAEENYRMAVELAPRDPQAAWQYASFEQNRGEVAHAILLMAPILEWDALDPEVPGGLWVNYLHLGDEERAAAWVQESARRNPQAEVSWLGQAVLAYYRGQDDEAYSICDEHLGQPLDNRFGSENVCRMIVRDVSLSRGDTNRARAVMEAWRPGVTAIEFTIDPELNSLISRLNALPVIAATEGQETAERIARELQERYKDGGPPFSASSHAAVMAILNAFLGKSETSVSYLREVQRLSMRDNPWFWYQRNSLFAPIANTPEFKAFMAERDAAAEEQLKILRASGREPPLPVT